MKEIFLSANEGDILINNDKIRFIILQDNTCLIAPDSIYKIFGNTLKGREKTINTTKTSFLHTPFLVKHTDKHLKTLLTPTTYKDSNNTVNYGYKIELINKVVTIFITNKTEIPKNQLDLFNRCTFLKNRVLKKDLTLLVYQQLNHPFKLEKQVLSESMFNYIDKDLQQFTSVIPILFYLELFRLNNWKFNEDEIKKRPSIIAKWVNALIFNQFSEEQKDSLKTTTPNQAIKQKTAFVQDIFEINVGNQLLNTQLIRIITIMSMSFSMKEAFTHLKKSNKLQSTETTSPFLFDDKGFTIEPLEESFLSDFNLKLTIALNYNLK